MTDKEKLKSLLTEFTVEFEESQNSVICTEGSHAVGGYTGFFTDFIFDDNGKFIAMGAWE